MMNPPSPEISVIIPIYNESENLPELQRALEAALTALNRPWEIIYVNDGSQDASRERLDALAAREPQVRVVHFARNYGQTAAMMAGFGYARGHIIVPMDGDLQNDPADICRLLAKLDEGYDVVSGWRRDRQDHPVRRTFLSRLANRIISRASGVSLHDYGCSLKAYRKNVLIGMHLYGEMHRFIPIYATWNGARVTEIPVTHYPRRHGRSHYGMERIFKVLLDLMVVLFFQRYAQKPMYVFGSCGLISFLVSGGAGALAVYYKFFGGKSFIQTPLPLLFVMAFITGVMCILMGLLAELSIRIYHESQAKPTYLISGLRNFNSAPDAGARLAHLVHPAPETW